MIVTVGNSKGGVGKSSLAASIVLSEPSFAVGTNETFTLWPELVEEDRFAQIDPLTPFNDYRDCGVDVLFDLSGDITSGSLSIVSAVEQSDVILVPTDPVRSSIYSTISYIESIREINSNVIVIANMLEKNPKERSYDWGDTEEFMRIEALLAHELDDTPLILPLKKTNAFKAMWNQSKGIEEMMEEKPLLKYHYQSVVEQIQDIKDAMGYVREE